MGVQRTYTIPVSQSHEHNKGQILNITFIHIISAIKKML